jgi:hypothetical protein
LPRQRKIGVHHRHDLGHGLFTRLAQAKGYAHQRRIWPQAWQVGHHHLHIVEMH